MKWGRERADHHGAVKRRYRTRGGTVSSWGFVISPEQILQTAKELVSLLS